MRGSGGSSSTTRRSAHGAYSYRSILAAVAFATVLAFVALNALAPPTSQVHRVDIASAPEVKRSVPIVAGESRPTLSAPETQPTDEEAGERTALVKKLGNAHSGDSGHVPLSTRAQAADGVPEPTVVRADGTFQLPYLYPLHKNLPPREDIEKGVLEDQVSAHRVQRCLQRAAPVFFDPPATMIAAEEPTRSAELEKEFAFTNPSTRTFYAEATEELGEGNRPWWVPISGVHPDEEEQTEEPAAPAGGDGVDRFGEGLDFAQHPDGQYDTEGNLPCTEHVQRRLWLHQHPVSCSDARFLVSRLKEGAHGIGSALTLVAHDFLSALILGRILVIDSRTPWYFSSPNCGSNRRGWDCLFAPPSPCPVPPSHTVVSSKSEAQRSSSKAIRKKSFDIPGLGRNDMPSAEKFFGQYNVATRGKCFTAVKRWLKDPANTYVMGTFEKGADPMLFIMMAQITRYLMRAPQPWFRAMLSTHFSRLNIPDVAGRSSSQLTQAGPLAASKTGGRSPNRKSRHAESGEKCGAAGGSAMMVYVQERGEVAKYREYYNAFGCHTVDNAVFVHFIADICNHTYGVVGNVGDSGGRCDRLGAASPSVEQLQRCTCLAYISGNTPVKAYDGVKASLEERGVGVLSTWMHPSLSSAQESQRWGASAPFASWVDLYAGVASTGWVCTVQSNWCRVINFLRLTSGRAQCPFVDLGALMISSATARAKYCIVKRAWPTKPFGGRIA